MCVASTPMISVCPSTSFVMDLALHSLLILWLLQPMSAHSKGVTSLLVDAIISDNTFVFISNSETLKFIYRTSSYLFYNIIASFIPNPRNICSTLYAIYCVLELYQNYWH